MNLNDYWKIILRDTQRDSLRISTNVQQLVKATQDGDNRITLDDAKSLSHQSSAIRDSYKNHDTTTK